MDTNNFTFSGPPGVKNPIFTVTDTGVYHTLYPMESEREIKILNADLTNDIEISLTKHERYILRKADLNNQDLRESLWEHEAFKEALGNRVGKIVAKAENHFWEGEHTFDPDVITEFFTTDYGHHEYFLLGCLWLDMERYVYYEDLNRKHGLWDACCNAWSDFTSEPSKYTDNPEPNLEATYY